MTSHMKEVAKLLGVELEEVFRLEKYESYFRRHTKKSDF